MLLQALPVKKRGLTLAELMVAGGLLASIATITTLMFSNLRATINRSSGEMEATQRARLALERVPPLLSAAYVPALSGASLPLETPIAPLPGGVSVSDPLVSTGPGCDSILFYACSDLMSANPSLPLPDNIVPRLYEIRLKTGSGTDPSGQGRTLRTLVLQEYQLPSAFGVRPLTLKTSVPARILGYGLADFRVWRQSNSALRMQASVHYTSATLRNYQSTPGLKTYQFAGSCLLPTTCLR
ncbi:hypothetical protein ABS71_04855 [bacterium SCN 62-11]|nr:hypothetical protein [Candidatus Eremiobacteraeota bacterium]ODT75084.1 MAG: hypothetical protein ABS71_04855 [bacterium SCN 62-11]